MSECQRWIDDGAETLVWLRSRGPITVDELAKAMDWPVWRVRVSLAYLLGHAKAVGAPMESGREEWTAIGEG